jgi:hypothetical protein
MFCPEVFSGTHDVDSMCDNAPNPASHLSLPSVVILEFLTVVSQYQSLLFQSLKFSLADSVACG